MTRFVPLTVLLSLLAFGETGSAQGSLASLAGDHIELRTPISFAVGGAVLTPEASSVLDEVVRILRQHPDIRIEVGVHTDARGSSEFNQSVSQARAEAIRQYLIRHGIAGARVQARGFGESVPIDTNSTEAGRARNRRVEIAVRTN